MRIHPAALLVRPLCEEQYLVLQDDIAAYGQRFPIILFEGAILDGRARWMACEALGIEPKLIELSSEDIGGDPVAFVVSANLMHRHLPKATRFRLHEAAIFFDASDRGDDPEADDGDDPATGNSPSGEPR